MKNFVILSIMVFSANFIQAQQSFNSEIEEGIYNCIIEEYNKAGVSLEAELNKLEAFLINSDYLENASKESYLEMYEWIFDSDESTRLPDYSSINLDLQQYRLIDGCIAFQINKLSPSEPMRKVYYEFTKLNFLAGSDPSAIYRKIMNNLKAGDFSNSLFKLYIQYQFYSMSTPIGLAQYN